MNTAFPTIPTAIVTQIFGNYNPSMYSGDGKHKGIDYGIRAGTSIYACMPGTVTTAITSQTGYGRHIRISHPDGSLSIYGHLTKLLVEVGNTVEAGQEIGKSGGDPLDGIDGDGFSTGAHLHWEIRPPESLSTDQGAVDPVQWCMKYLPGPWREAQVTADIGLNVRTSPVNGNVLYALRKRELVKVIETIDGWSRLLALRTEWCSSSWLFMTGVVQDVELPPVVVPGEYTDAEKLFRLWNAHPELH